MPRPLSAALPALALAALLALTPAVADHHDEAGMPGPYRKATIDVGVIVTDAHAAEEFYEDALGFEEVDEFTVSAEVAGDSGLTDYRQFTAHVMTIGEGEAATRIKLIAMPGPPAARPDNRFVNSTLGPSYLTLHVDDIDAALKTAAEHGVKPLAKGPTKVGGRNHIALLRDPDGNFVELVGPRPNSAEERLEDAADEAGDAVEAAADAVDAAVEDAPADEDGENEEGDDADEN